MGNNKKPPIGLIPKSSHDRNRFWDIVCAMHRYMEVGKEIPRQWLDEYNTLCKEVDNHET